MQVNGKNLKVFILRKKTLFLIAAVILIVAVFTGAGFYIAEATRVSAPADAVRIVLDAGHGGVDHGVIGQSGTKESDFNLAMTKRLAALLSSAGFTVVLTRETEDGLYGEDAGAGFKRRDMAKRKEIIVKNAPDLVVSIHANKFPDKKRRGAQVFFDEFSTGGQTLADDIQTALNRLNQREIADTFDALKGDYFMLKCTRNPSVIVECGFLSNIDDEKLLTSEGYQEELAFAVYSGIVAFFNG